MSPPPTHPANGPAATSTKAGSAPGGRRGSMNSEGKPAGRSGPRITPDPVFDSKRAAFDRKMAETDTELTTLRTRQRVVSNDIQALTSGDVTKGGPKAELRHQLSELRKKKESLEAARAPLVNKLKDTQEAYKRRTEELDSAKDKLPFKRADDIDRKIQELEKQLESGALKLIDEKRTVAEISKLIKSRKSIEALSSQQGSLEQLDTQIKSLRATLQERDKEINAVRDEMRVVSDNLKKLDADRPNNQSRLKALFAERDELKASIDKVFAERTAAYTEFQAAQDAHRKFVDAERLKREQVFKCREIEDTIRDLERDLKRLDLPPCSDELSMCDKLVTYFKVEVLKETPAAPAEAAPTHSADLAAAFAPLEARKVEKVDPSLIIKGKSARDAVEEEAYSFCAPKKAAGKPPGLKKAAPKEDNGTVKLPLWVMADLDTLGLKLITNVQEVPATLSALDAKKKSFEALQTEKLRTIDDQRAAVQVRIDEAKKRLAEEPAKVAAAFAVKLKEEAKQREATQAQREAERQAKRDATAASKAAADQKRAAGPRGPAKAAVDGVVASH